MISIVVCSIKNEDFDRFQKSVETTIGVPYEIIRIDNSQNRYSICEAYNKGKAECKYDIICFSHEDIWFETENWGKTLCNILEERKIGLVGIFGACYISAFSEDPVNRNECEGQVIEAYKMDKPIVKVSRFNKNSIAEVIGVDGVFMVTRKTIADEISFANDILKGFHGYDFDVSFQIRQKYKIVITRDILIAHLSVGNYGTSYYDAITQIVKKWHKYLPMYVSYYSKKEIDQLKLKSLQTFYQKNLTRKNAFVTFLISVKYALKQNILRLWLNEFI